MEVQELQRRLVEWGFYSGDSDGIVGALTMQAIAAFLNNGRVLQTEKWSQERLVNAAKQLVCRRLDIEVGAIDGLVGPQTRYAFSVYAERFLGVPMDVERPTDGTNHSHSKIWPRQKDVGSFFGPMGVNQVRLQLPYPMVLSWNRRQVIHSFEIHEKVHDSALRCFERVAATYSAEQRERLGLNIYGGCLSVRRMRGSDTWSMHSWGIAIDFDPDRNQLNWNKEQARLAKPDCEDFWKIWEDEGWISLGRAANFDWMHVQAARF